MFKTNKPFSFVVEIYITCKKQTEKFIILPLTVMLFFKSRNGLKQADSIMILIAGSILAGPLISLITDFYFILPYRFIPFIVFMAIGIGLLFSKKD